MTFLSEPSAVAPSAKNKRGVPRSVWLGLIAAVMLDTLVQMCWKSAVLAVPESAGMVQTVLITACQPIFWVALVGYGLLFFNWMRVLSRADLSFAQPITALSYISVGACSAIFLHESITPARIAGIVLILIGVWFISQTEHRTTPAKGKSNER